MKGRKILAFEEKTYVCDLGFFHLKKNRVKDEYNYMVETLCYNELISQGYQVYVGKTYKNEVDFIAAKGEKKIYVQAAYLLADETVLTRTDLSKEGKNSTLLKCMIRYAEQI